MMRISDVDLNSAVSAVGYRMVSEADIFTSMLHTGISLISMTDDYALWGVLLSGV